MMSLWCNPEPKVQRRACTIGAFDRDQHRSDAYRLFTVGRRCFGEQCPYHRTIIEGHCANDKGSRSLVIGVYVDRRRGYKLAPP